MEKTDYLIFLLTFLGGAIVASLSRIWKLLNNLHLVRKKENGKTNWTFEIIYLFINSLLGGLVGLGAYILIKYSGYITDQAVLTFVSCMFATASGEVFLMVQNKVIKTVEKLEKENIDETTFNKQR
jgi:hypothetical protein